MQGEMFFLYIIAHLNEEGAFSGPVKIGRTCNIDKRPKALQTGNPYKIGVYAKIPFSSEDFVRNAEKCFHEIFENVGLEGEWFDTEPERVLERYFFFANMDKEMRRHLEERIKNLEWEIFTLKLTLSEQDEVLENIFRSKCQDRNDRIFDEYSKKMSEKYKNALRTIESVKNGKKEIIFGTPYWQNLAER